MAPREGVTAYPVSEAESAVQPRQPEVIRRRGCVQKRFDLEELRPVTAALA
jgi:hypothetical protein